MRLFHTPLVASAVFDEPNLVSAAGLVPVMALARRAGLGELAQARLSVPSDKGANAGLKICSLVAGTAAGADSIELCRPCDYADKLPQAVANAQVRSGFLC